MHKLLRVVALVGAVVSMEGSAAEEPKTPPPRRSAMFTASEISQILAAISEGTNPHAIVRAPVGTSEEAKPAVPNIYVAAVADYGSGRWTVWANGHRIIPGRQAPGFQVLSVRDDRVDIMVEGDTPAHIILRPHQTWLSASNDVVEGIVP